MPSSSARSWRVGAVVVAVTALVGLLAGCGEDAKTPGVATAEQKPSSVSSTATATDPRDGALGYVRCMRKEGIEMDDPKPDGQLSYPPEAKRDKAFGPASEKCSELLPPGGGQAAPPPLTEEQLADMRRYAACMRDNGVTDFKDPTAQGFTDDGPQSDTPTFKKAYKACVRIIQPNADPEATGVG